ncbi:50S ribosomal protein L9 [Pseudolabrys sp. Root1462]|uniref:50S ribosomal protein L9 n=1 Tax=Pseudolabrys sp. Root1462 TaxID=1736466 RepID=UPI0007027C8B|nr:50S ribosomal protein L9 [Pseudolabrys sp. Root1462]KQZ01292.1 50S ribosomal protein L9 [Pseudolabrys sp. Root1462]
MEVILLERVGKLGKMGDVVRVKDGYARNFLLPRNKALRANADNKARFESMKAELETQSLERKGEAGKIAAKVDGKQFTIIRQSSETGQLYGSVTSRDIATLISTDGLTISRAQVELNAPIKALGLYKVALGLHPDMDVSVTVIVARSESEAERIARGEDVTVRASVAEDAEAEAQAARERAEALFDAESEEAEGGEAEAEAETEAQPAKGKKKASEEA